LAGLILLIFIVCIFLIAIFFKRGVRRFFIGAAEILVLFANIIFVLVCGFWGSTVFGDWLLPRLGIFIKGMPIEGFLLGALIGFLISATLSAIFFLLVDIAENTRKTVSFFDRVSSHNSEIDQ